MNEVVAGIAKRVLRIETLEERKSDSLDFHEVAVWDVKEALKQAYEAGLRAAKLNDEPAKNGTQSEPTGEGN